MKTILFTLHLINLNIIYIFESCHNMRIFKYISPLFFANSFHYSSFLNTSSSLLYYISLCLSQYFNTIPRHNHLKLIFSIKSFCSRPINIELYFFKFT